MPTIDARLLSTKLPVEIHYEILSYLTEFGDQISASQVCALWKGILEHDKVFREARYSLQGTAPGLLRVHHLLLPTKLYRLSCTVQSGKVECYKMIFTPNDDVWDITSSAFLDEPPFQHPGNIEQPVAHEVNLDVMPHRRGSRIERYGCYGGKPSPIPQPMAETLRQLIVDATRNLKHHHWGPRILALDFVDINIPQEYTMRFDSARFQQGWPEPEAVLSGTVIQRAGNSYQQWLTQDTWIRFWSNKRKQSEDAYRQTI